MTTEPTNIGMIQERDAPHAPTEAELRAVYEEVMERRTNHVNKDILAELRHTFEQEYEGLIEGAKEEALLLAEAEAIARSLTIAAYHADPEHKKAVLPGCLGIREVKDVVYDPKEALAWAKEHGMALRLDEGAYKKVVLMEGSDAPGVVKTVITATIATASG